MQTMQTQTPTPSILDLDVREIEYLQSRMTPQEASYLDALLKPHFMPLAEYVKQAWPVLEPATPYSHNWHIEAISEHLEAVTQGWIRNLVINIPPRHMKSLTVSVFWPTWTWTWRPETRWLFSAYAEALATRDSLKCRRLIQSSWYQSRWGHVFRLTGDQNEKKRFENDKTGYRIATGVGGIGTGEGGDVVVVDDPHKVKEVESDTVRQGVLDWWDETMSTRLNNPQTGAKVIIMQRVHERDLTGHVLEKMQAGEGERYEHLCLPAEYEKRVYVSGIDFADPRREAGELLWPERFDRPAVDNLKAALGLRAAAGQLQQRPAPAGGLIFLEQWWAGKNRYDAGDSRTYTANVARLISWDTALKDGEENDLSAMVVLDLMPDYRLMLRHAWWDKLQFPALVREIERQAVRWNYDGKLRWIVVEDKGSGTSSIQTLQSSAPQWIQAILTTFQPRGSKENRAKQASLWCEKDCVLFPAPSETVPWLFDFCRWLFNFPNAAYDDPVDALDQGLIFLENYVEQGWRARMGNL